MDAMTLLREAQEAGLQIAVVGDSLEIVGPKSATPSWSASASTRPKS